MPMNSNNSSRGTQRVAESEVTDFFDQHG